MNNILYWLLVVVLVNVQAKLHSRKIDPKELKCLVCRTTIKEFSEAIGKIDPTHKLDIGGYRIDAKGNLQQKQVLKAKSETHLSFLASDVCNTMDNYIRGTWKDDGKLTVFKLLEDGQMSSKFTLVDIIQDDDLNKSLKYYCEEIMEQHDDTIIQHYLDDVENIANSICMEHANYCTPEDFIEVEHVAPPGSENDFASQFGLNPNLNMGESEDKVDEPAPLDDDTDSFVTEGDDVKDEL